MSVFRGRCWWRGHEKTTREEYRPDSVTAGNLVCYDQWCVRCGRVFEHFDFANRAVPHPGDKST